MADATDAFSTIDDFLLSLAEGVSHAQAELARAGVSGPPGAQVLYQLPRVEFELKMNLTVVQDQVLSQRYRYLRAIRPNDKHLLFKPLTSEEASSTLEIAATVTGAFIAVPANNGLPAPVMRTTVDPSDPQAPSVRVSVSNAAGEPMSGVEVQLNVDREESVALNQAAGSEFAVAPGTGFDQGVLVTDAGGTAHTVLRIDAGQAPGLLVIAIDALSRTDEIVYEVAT
jgi:hypothetical protein